MDMDIMLQPSFHLGPSKLYLQSDVVEYLKLMGTETVVEEEDIFTNEWREVRTPRYPRVRSNPGSKSSTR